MSCEIYACWRRISNWFDAGLSSDIERRQRQHLSVDRSGLKALNRLVHELR